MDSKILNLLESSKRTMNEKQATQKEMNELFEQVGTIAGVGKKSMSKAKDYNYYYGRGVNAEDPILGAKAKGEKFPCRLLPVFKNLYECLLTLKVTGYTHLADNYLAALEKHGVKIDFENIDVETSNNVELVHNAVNRGQSMQHEICQLADSIKLGDASTSESFGFTTKGEYVKVVKFFDKKSNDKEVSGDYGKQRTNYNAYAEIFLDKNIGSPRE